MWEDLSSNEKYCLDECPGLITKKRNMELLEKYD
jgi:hypothetical protein